MNEKITDEQLQLLTKLEYSNDCPTRYIRLMADELLRLRSAIKNCDAATLENEAIQWPKDLNWNMTDNTKSLGEQI